MMHLRKSCACETFSTQMKRPYKCCMRMVNPPRASHICGFTEQAEIPSIQLSSMITNPTEKPNTPSDGHLEISNNRAERSIKPFVIGRKNWLFANTPRGAKASAILFSIVETAKENNLNPYEYLTYIFTHAPNWDIPNNINNLERLLPWFVPDSCKALKQHLSFMLGGFCTLMFYAYVSTKYPLDKITPLTHICSRRWRKNRNSYHRL